MTNAARDMDGSRRTVNTKATNSPAKHDLRTLPASTDVMIVGAGPTGLVLGGILAKRGIPFLLVDKLAEGTNTSRACVVHARTLEALEELDVTERLCSKGHVVPVFTVRDRDDALTTMRFDRLPTRYPFTLMIPQDVTEAILLQRLREMGEDVYRPYTVTGLRQDADGVTVDVALDGQERHTVRARYVIGADGAHSTVRERAGIGFAGDAYEQSSMLADVRMSWPLPNDEVSLFFSPRGLVVVAPLPGGRYRVVATVDEVPEHPDIAYIQRVLDERGPVAVPARVEEIAWGSRFRVHHRVAERYRSGRVLIAGDAAHVHSPAGGQGMNTGIQDAVALGHALAEVLAARNGEDPLDEYERERRPVAEHVVALTDRITRAATISGESLRSIRNAVIRLVGSIPAVRRRMAFELAELRYR
jgi:2-polyprenyl-6-methoxyphenol hydroxylase-like FAD-dependent oxidoreductase